MLKAQQADQQRELNRLRLSVNEHQKFGEPQAAATATPAPAALAEKTTARGPQVIAPAEQPVGRGGPRIPDRLKVVYVAPDSLEFKDPPGGEPAQAAPTPTPGKPAKAVAPAPLSVETPLREPLDVSEVSQDPAVVLAEYTAALAAPAGDKLEAFERLHPDDMNADNALYEAGVRAEKAGATEKAVRDFQRVASEHPAGDVTSDALLHLASCQRQLRQPAAARATLASLVSKFPTSSQAEVARARLAELEK